MLKIKRVEVGVTKKKFFSPQDNYLDIYMSIYADSFEDESEWINVAEEVDFDFTHDIVPDSKALNFTHNHQISSDCFFEDIDYLCSVNQIPPHYFDNVDRHLIMVYSNGNNLFLGIRARLAEKAVTTKLKESGFSNVIDRNWVMAQNFLSGNLSFNSAKTLREHIHSLDFDLQASMNGTTFKYDVKSAWGENPLLIKNVKSYTNLVLVRFSRGQSFDLKIIGALDALSVRSIQDVSVGDRHIELADSLFSPISTNQKKAAS